MPRTKMTRHQLKEQDEITTTLQAVTDFIVDRKKELIAGSAVVVVLALSFFGWRYYSASRNAAAEAQLSQAINAYNDVNIKSEKERYEKTIAEAEKTRERYGSLPAGSIAQYYIALSQEGLGDTAKAIDNLQQVSQRGDAVVKPVAQFALAQIYKKHGETQKAIDAYKQLFDSGAYSKPAVAYELASAYEANKQMDQAKEYYQKVVSDFPDSPFRQNADDALKRLGAPVPAPVPAQKPS